ncbi:internal alternative NAD(P)H-ubiquinone oxidoreductase A1, mitochondrial-like [Gigantopelta aegis]|uniref:internal alternative NAD(P)H-ubiquinone oxidoreductase A1, mitochondrial-like n=1 Tax=Gigantopelta aegis TaxID=1735272 RepID=UPI001B888C66|nr:internal alternative NAD(P)H-ubiquinone oxidoreductase A1, mitochondrial-like [Gigantopelta aegis]
MASNACTSNMLKCVKRNLFSYFIQCCGHSRAQHSSVKSGRKQLIILGTGWSSYSVLKTIDKTIYDVIVVSPRNHFLFTPLLCSTTVGTLEFRSIIEPVRNSGFRQSAHFHLSRAVGLDTEEKTLVCESVLKQSLRYTLSYDKLVIGVGSLSNTFGVPGVSEHAFFLKEVADARRIRNRLLHNIELAVQPRIEESEANRLLHIVIVGGGPTGIEFGAEVYDFVEQDVARLYKQQKHKVFVTLIESNQILSSFDDRLRSFATKKIKERARFDLVQSSVVEVTEMSVKLKDGKVLPCGLVVWSTGLQPRDFTRSLHVATNNRGQIETDSYLRVKTSGDTTDVIPDVFAIGDCADIENQPLPTTAQVAEREGRYVAKFLNSNCSSDTKPFKFVSSGMMTYIGGYQALADTPEIKLQGFPSWVLWRSAYLTRLGSWRLRMQVPMDWMKTLVFGRDISRFE